MVVLCGSYELIRNVQVTILSEAETVPRPAMEMLQHVHGESLKFLVLRVVAIVVIILLVNR